MGFGSRGTTVFAMKSRKMENMAKEIAYITIVKAHTSIRNALLTCFEQ